MGKEKNMNNKFKDIDLSTLKGKEYTSEELDKEMGGVNIIEGNIIRAEPIKSDDGKNYLDAFCESVKDKN